MLQPKSSLKKFTRKATNEEAARFKAKEEGTPKIVSKLERKEKIIFKDTPTKMATRPASAVPSKDLPSKLNAAVKKAKELGISNDKPKVKGTGVAYPYQPTKASNDSPIRYKSPTATVSKSKSTEKGFNGNVPMGSGSKSKPSSESSYRNRE